MVCRESRRFAGAGTWLISHDDATDVIAYCQAARYLVVVTQATKVDHATDKPTPT